jgi:CheY-like chemotaxis protein
LDKSGEKHILIVDDQESDQAILIRGLQRLGVGNPIHRVADGHEALRFFNGDTPYSDRQKYPFPSIIFLDLQLPMVSGWAVLEWLHALDLSRKADAQIFIYSELQNVSEVRNIYALGATSFFRKPIAEVDLMNLIYHFPKHWDIQSSRASL